MSRRAVPFQIQKRSPAAPSARLRRWDLERANAELEEGSSASTDRLTRSCTRRFGAWSQAVGLIARLAAEFGGSPAALTHIGLHAAGWALPQCEANGQVGRTIPTPDVPLSVADQRLLQEQPLQEVQFNVCVEPVAFIEGELRHSTSRWASNR